MQEQGQAQGLARVLVQAQERVQVRAQVPPRALQPVLALLLQQQVLQELSRVSVSVLQLLSGWLELPWYRLQWTMTTIPIPVAVVLTGAQTVVRTAVQMVVRTAVRMVVQMADRTPEERRVRRRPPRLLRPRRLPRQRLQPQQLLQPLQPLHREHKPKQRSAPLAKKQPRGCFFFWAIIFNDSVKLGPL